MGPTPFDELVRDFLTYTCNRYGAYFIGFKTFSMAKFFEESPSSVVDFATKLSEVISAIPLSFKIL